MANIIDYIDWRGDLGFECAPFNDVDALILAQLSYLPFDGILTDDVTMTVREISEHFIPEKIPEKLRIISFRDDCTLLKKMGSSERFGKLPISGFTHSLSAEREEQFAALTCELPDGKRYISFRGTDDTIAGWKEDFNFSYLSETPSQARAVKYVNSLEDDDSELILGGHSKGGNLAVYAAVFCEERKHDRIRRIYDFDGPGFRSETADSEDYRRTIPLITSIIPESSLVGQLLTANVQHSIVKSNASGLMQHLVYSWQVKRDRPDFTDELSTAGSIINKTVSTWLGGLDDETRRMTVKAIFALLEAPDAETFTELGKGKLKTYAAILNGIRKLAPEQQKVLMHAFKKLAASGWDALLSQLNN